MESLATAIVALVLVNRFNVELEVTMTTKFLGVSATMFAYCLGIWGAIGVEAQADWTGGLQIQ